MPSRSRLLPTAMRRTAIVAPDSHLRRVLVEVADLGQFESDPLDATDPGPVDIVFERVAAGRTDVSPRLAVDPVDPDDLVSRGELGLLSGEAELERHAASVRHTGRCSILPGWIPSDQIGSVRAAVAPYGGAVVDLPGRRGIVPPTAHADSAAGTAFRPLVTTYATVPYRDIDPTLFAAFAYMLMFGMMFGDVGHGVAIVALGVVALVAQSERWPDVRRVAPFLIGAGVAATAFGFLYGEAFGPTGLVPTLWLRPLDEPERLLMAGLVVGGVLLAITSVAASVNRWRESGPTLAFYDAAGIAGALLLFGFAGVVIGIATSTHWLWQVGTATAAIGTVLTFIGLFVGAGSGASGLAEAVVEMFDTILRLGSNTVSFTRLAAFGLTHAVITEVVWDGAVSLWNRAALLAGIAAVALFAIGNLAAFALGALVGAIQALRLEYYELFSRLFVSQGRPFRPWHVPAQRLETP